MRESQEGAQTDRLINDFVKLREALEKRISKEIGTEDHIGKLVDESLAELLR